MTRQGRMLGGRDALEAMLGAGVGHMYRACDRVLRRTVVVAVGSGAASRFPGEPARGVRLEVMSVLYRY
jgi:hypothetical protein